MTRNKDVAQNSSIVYKYGAVEVPKDALFHGDPANPADVTSSLSDSLKPSSTSTMPMYDQNRTLYRNLILSRHLGSALLQRMWEFSVIMLLTVIGPSNSFHLIATYGITVNLTIALFSPSIGSYIDEANRLRAVVLVTSMQNTCVVGCCICFIIVLWGHIATGWALSLCVGLIHVGGALNMLFQGLSNIILEREWVVVLAEDDDAWLRSITTNLKAIDLSSNVVAPFLVSVIQSVGSNCAVAWTLSILNFLMIYLQYLALLRIYQEVPALAKKDRGVQRSDHDAQVGDDAVYLDKTEEGLERGHTTELHVCYKRITQKFSHFFGLIESRFSAVFRNGFLHAQIYARQRTFLPGLAMAILYFTVLTFHNTMLAYLLSQGLNLNYVAMAQGGSAAMGVLGTLSYKWAATRFGTVGVGIVGLWQQVACLTVAVAALYVPLWRRDRHIYDKDVNVVSIATAAFMGSVGLSRLGLIAFDVAGAQLFQYLVDEESRGVVGGFQRTLESMFELLMYFLVLWRPRPDQFPSSAALSYIAVVAAALIFSFFACRVRDIGFVVLKGGFETDEDRIIDHGGSRPAAASSPILSSNHYDKWPVSDSFRLVGINTESSSQETAKQFRD
jgi:iron-regulated transporter 1